MELVLGAAPAGLRRPILLAGFGGWGDAGSAATIALRHLLGEDVVEASGMLDPSACYDFTVARPLTRREGGAGAWQLEYPKVSFHPLRLPAARRDLLVVQGPEPHFRWPELAPAIVSYARAAGAELVVTLGAYVGPVSHRSAPVVGRTLDPRLAGLLRSLRVRDTDYQGPTAFVTALLHAAAASGLPALSLWAATPPYLQAGNPVAALALLETTQRVTQLPLDATRLSEVARSFLREVDAALQEHPDLAEQLKELLGAAGAEAAEDEEERATLWKVPDPDRPPPDAPPGLPTGKSLVEAVERYLKQARGDAPAPGE